MYCVNSELFANTTLIICVYGMITYISKRQRFRRSQGFSFTKFCICENEILANISECTVSLFEKRTPKQGCNLRSGRKVTKKSYEISTSHKTKIPTRERWLIRFLHECRHNRPLIKSGSNGILKMLLKHFSR